MSISIKGVEIFLNHNGNPVLRLDALGSEVAFEMSDDDCSKTVVVSCPKRGRSDHEETNRSSCKGLKNQVE